jgi:hypothetical protein
VTGAGDVVVTLGQAGSLVGLAGAMRIDGSALGGPTAGQNLTVVVDARSDPRTLRIDIQRGVVSVVDTGSNRGVFRVIHTRVNRLVVHGTDFVSVDHGDNATTYVTETEIHVHNHTADVPSWCAPAHNDTRLREVRVARVCAPVAVVAWAPVDVVRFGVFPDSSSPSARWNDCATNGLACTAHPLQGIDAPVYIISTSNASNPAYGGSATSL